MEKEGNLADVVKFMGSEIDIPDAILDNEIAKGVYLDILEVVRSMQFEKASYILNAVREDKQFYQEEVKGFFYRKGGNR